MRADIRIWLFTTYEGVLFNIISIMRGWWRSNFQGTKHLNGHMCKYVEY